MAGVTKQIPKVLVLVLFGSLLVACADVSALLRRHTYPPNFKYITREQLRSAMWQLAEKVNALDALMRQPGPIDATRRTEVRQLLTAMRAATTALQAQGQPTNHPLIGEHLDSFQRDLTLALTGVELEPPNYYLVGSVSGACLACHSPN
jgi:hypothetical protein